MFGEIGGALELVVNFTAVMVGLAILVALGKFWET